MESTNNELHFVFMNYDPEYERLRSSRFVFGFSPNLLFIFLHYEETISTKISVLTTVSSLICEFLSMWIICINILVRRSKRGAHERHLYLSKKHDDLLANTLEPGSYKKTRSLVIVDGFAVEITDDQANVLRSAKDVRLVEKNQELA